MITESMILAEAADNGWSWVSTEAQIAISNYGLIFVTLLATVIEIYKLIKIERELKIIERAIAAIIRPMRLRRMSARRQVKRIERQAASNPMPVPSAIAKGEETRRIERVVVNSNRGFFN